MTDTSNLSLSPLMLDAMRKEFALAHAWRPMPPPTEGNYLVRVEIEDAARGVVMKSVRLDYYNGERWLYRGGYVAYTGWMETPAV